MDEDSELSRYIISSDSLDFIAIVYYNKHYSDIIIFIGNPYIEHNSYCITINVSEEYISLNHVDYDEKCSINKDIMPRGKNGTGLMIKIAIEFSRQIANKLANFKPKYIDLTDNSSYIDNNDNKIILSEEYYLKYGMTWYQRILNDVINLKPSDENITILNEYTKVHNNFNNYKNKLPDSESFNNWREYLTYKHDQCIQNKIKYSAFLDDIKINLNLKNLKEIHWKGKLSVDPIINIKIHKIKKSEINKFKIQWGGKIVRI